MNLAGLREAFGIPGCLDFVDGPGGLPVISVRSATAQAAIALHGAHVLSFQPTGHRPVLWLSRHARFEAGVPIRGGIPICWPWFGSHPRDPGSPFHGFARIRTWDVLGTGVTPAGDVFIRMGLSDDADTRVHWPHAFRLGLTVSVGRSLRVTLSMAHAGPDEVVCTAALHTYFAVSDVRQVSVAGLDGRSYIDTVGGGATRRKQAGTVTVSAETDRVYLDTPDACVIEDPAWHRRIRVEKLGSRTTVVWNPWVEKAKRMADFGDDEYPQMICVETANAEDDAVRLAPGGVHELATEISSELNT